MTMLKTDSIDKIGITGHIGLLLLRMYVGISMMLAGMDKIPLPTWMIEQVESISWMPLPFTMSWLACFSEFAGGFLITIGLFTRPAAFMLSITMAVAAFSSQGVELFTGIHVTQGYLWSYVALIGLGAGRISLDHFFGKRAVLIGVVVTLLLGTYSLVQGVADPKPEISENFVVASIHIPGSFNNWNPEAAEMTALGDSLYSKDLLLPQGINEFKIALNRTWEENFGIVDQSAEGFPIDIQGMLDDGGSTDNIKVFIPAPGEYRFQFDLKDFRITVDSIHMISHGS